MEPNLEALSQRVEWLDQERRKAHSLLLTLQERLTSMEGGLSALQEGLKQLSDEVARLNGMLGKVDHLEARLAEAQTQESKARAELEQTLLSRVRQQEEQLRLEAETLRQQLTEMRKRLDAVQAWESRLEVQDESLEHLRGALRQYEQRLHQLEEAQAGRLHQYRLLQEAQDRESRRLTDLQGEVTALRKRLEEGLGQTRLFGEQLSKLESRLQDLANAEAERRREMREFVESQTRQQVERERLWKQWEARFAEIDALLDQLQAQVTAWNELGRNLKRAQAHFEEMTERMERRVHEITEMQRLAEDRFRQEWNAFKADDQKRWANYLLSQEEKGREVDRQLEKLRDGLGILQDRLQELHDLVHLSEEQAQKRLQALAELAQTWLQEYERVLGALR